MMTWTRRIALGFGMLLWLFAAGCSSSDEAEDQTTPPTDEESRFKNVDAGRPTVVPQGEPTDTPPPADMTPPPSEEQTPPPSMEPPMEKPPERPIERSASMMWSVQIGAFRNETGAVDLITQSKGKLRLPVYKDYDPVTSFYKVTVGSFQTREQATQYKNEIQTAGFPDAFVVEVRR